MSGSCKHSEPILLVGIPESQLTKFVKQYLGKFVGDKIEVGSSRPGEGMIGVDAISGATVTVIAENQVILRSGLGVARQVGIVKPTIRPQAKFKDVPGILDWQALLDEGSVQRTQGQGGRNRPGVRRAALHRHLFRLPQRPDDRSQRAGRAWLCHR